MLGSLVNVRLELGAQSALVEVDPTQLETALLNAAVNARDAMPGGGALTIATSDCFHAEQPAICIAISDTGQGIAPEKLSRVFEPFFTTKDVGKGTGLGLSQIHGFAEQAGGRAEIESSVGKGTTLRIILPRTDKPVSEAAEEEEPQELPANLRVLLVEDNLQVRDFAAELLEDLHCEVVAASDGDEALRVLDGRDFDVVLSDVVMPGLSGVELAERIRINRPELPILLATGFAGRLHDEAAGRFAILPKPYDVSSLRRGLAAALAKAKAA